MDKVIVIQSEGMSWVSQQIAVRIAENIKKSEYFVIDPQNEYELSEKCKSLKI